MKNKLLLGTSGDAILLMCIKLITIALGFAVTRILSEYLSVYDYGTYSQVLLIVSTVSSMTILGMMDGVNYFYGVERNPQRREAYISTVFALQCIISTAAGAVVMILCKPLIAYFDNPGIRGLLVFAAILPMLQNLLGMMQILLVSVGHARMLAFRNLVVSVFRFVAALIIATLIRNVAVILWTTLILDFVQIILFLHFLKNKNCYIRLSSVDLKLSGRVLSFCAPMAVFTTINALNRDLDKYVIAAFTDTETLAIFSNASKALPFDIIMTSFCTVLIPNITRLIANRDNEGATTLYKLLLEISYISTTIFCCAALAVSGQLMKLLYSNKYEDGLAVFRIYILVDLLRFTNMTLILSAAGKTKKLMLLSLGSLIVNAVLNLLLFHLIGLIGPAIATLITTLLLGIIILVSGSKELGTNIQHFFDGKFLLVFVAENVVLTLLMHQAQKYLDALDVHYFIILLTVCITYGLIMLLLHGKRLLHALKRVNECTS